MAYIIVKSHFPVMTEAQFHNFKNSHGTWLAMGGMGEQDYTGNMGAPVALDLSYFCNINFLHHKRLLYLILNRVTFFRSNYYLEIEFLFRDWITISRSNLYLEIKLLSPDQIRFHV